MTQPNILELEADRSDAIMDALHRQDSITLRHLAVSATDDEEHDKLLQAARNIDDINNDELES